LWNQPTGTRLRLSDAPTQEIEAVDGRFDLSGYSLDQLKTQLQMLAPKDWSSTGQTLKAKVTVTTTEHGVDGGLVPGKDSLTRDYDVSYKVYGDADAPSLSIVDATQAVAEDAFYRLADGFTDGRMPALGETTGDGSETLTFTIIPAAGQAGKSRLYLKLDGEQFDMDAVARDTNGDGVYDVGGFLPAGADGTWAVPAANIGHVQIGGVADWASAETLSFTIRATATEADAGDTGHPTLVRQGSRWTEDTLTLRIDPVADSLTLGASDHGVEDKPIALKPSITLADTDGSETLSGTVYLVTADPDMLGGTITRPDGGTATPVAVIVNADGSLTEGTVAPGQTQHYAYAVPSSAFTLAGATYGIDGLVFTPPAHSAREVEYKIHATVRDLADGTTRISVGDGTVVIAAEADAPTVTVNNGNPVSGTEDTYIPLSVNAPLVDTDSEILSATLSGVPTGWQVGYWNGTTFTQASRAADGTWVLEDGSRFDQIAVRPPKDWHTGGAPDAFRLAVTSTEHGADVTNPQDANDGIVAGKVSATTTVDFTVTVNADADTPNLAVSLASPAMEDTDVKINIVAQITDQDSLYGRVGSETLSVFIAGDLKGGALVLKSGGAEQVVVPEGGVYAIPVDRLNDVWFRPAEDSDADVSLTVTARATEASNGDPADRAFTLDIAVAARADDLLQTGSLTKAVEEDAGWFDPGLGDLSTKDMAGADAA
ncbi:MAG: hypothetical protein AB1918_00460, partial [Pseudomonadota bacterium]